MERDKLKQELRKLKQIHALVLLGLTGLLFALSKTAYSDLYLFKWTADRFYVFVIPVVALMLLLGKFKAAYMIGIGNIVLVIFGQILGDILRDYNMSKITDLTTNEEAYRLSSHLGFEIWFFGMLLVILVTLLIERRRYRL